MNVADRVVFLREELDREQRHYQSSRERDKHKAIRVQMATVTLSATITVLLGIRVSAGVQPILADVALALGALLTVLAAYAAFYNHRGLWLNRANTIYRLNELRRQMDYRLAGVGDSEVEPEVVDELAAQLHQILEDEHHAWLRLRLAEVHPSIQGGLSAAMGSVVLSSRPDGRTPEGDG